MIPIIGIDPGATGAIGIIEDDHARVIKLPTDPAGYLEVMRALPKPARVWVEQVNSWPGDSPVTAFSFGRSLGKLETALAAAGFAFKSVVPQKWQMRMDLSRVPVRKDRKRYHRDLAKRLYPDCKGLTLATSDALLIARYGFEMGWV